MPDGMPVISAIFHAREDQDQNLCCETKHLCKTLVMNNMLIFIYLNENLSKIQRINKFAPKSFFSK